MSKNSHHHKNTAGPTEEARKDQPASQPPPQRDAGTSQEHNPETLQGAESEKRSEDPGSAGQGSAEKSPVEQKFAELEVKYAELNDQYLRKAADFENFRKRMIKEKQDLLDFSNQNLLLDLLPIIDDFDRAIKSAETSKDFASFYEGIIMIEKRLATDLENKWGLKRFDSGGQPFDPNRHEALQMEKAAGISETVVKDDFVKGYTLKDRVIRFAKVKVIVPESSSPETAGEKKAESESAQGTSG